MKVLTWNTLFAGLDGSADKRRKLQIEMINEIRPDIFLMQEAKGFELNKQQALFQMESDIAMRGFLGIAPRTGQNTAIFINPAYHVKSFEADSTHFHHAATFVSVAIPNFDKIVTFGSVHLCPLGPEIRRREATYLLPYADPDALSLITGDFNSLSPHDAEPADWERLSPHFRSRYFDGDNDLADRKVLQLLEMAGFVDCARAAKKNNITTVPCAAYNNAEFVNFRCDYMLASRALTNKLSHYTVIKNERTDQASDHYPVLAEFK
ncbi:exonuclease III [Arcticibacter tournemirensis]|uniref:Endonuclease/exonuclease/phosphatase family protein n=1 Tax=Arcticibacter tournemirensis TaxID=699437 RepID=A0A5M9HF21_9SPHI|nr:endonuclease/exonuclease/phosphatase family protein [Arcticibacter tournemirensis]KAA8485586.1 endonuclease/exonuclease/phosphatase family protein [Arcticibacter tournemirensis]TQM48697.1 exonuclease III [Arcticibacter tournemirensis]